ncbi:PAS domain S-box protein [Aerosakkonema funiforme]|uniref:PAS domain S-box protein n=2 Tax=Oscillatoriophycideae TaxID=1301283 RepID=UPI0018EF716D|nr:PAS domain S-box protein [Aerosakkonema funiforme]
MPTCATDVIPPPLKSAIVRHPLVVSPDTTVIDAIAQMSGARSFCQTTRTEDSQKNDLYVEARSSCVLVVENEQIIGILTERDVVRSIAQQQPLDRAVCEVMAHPVITLRESDFKNLFLAINLLQQYKIRHLPIVDDRNRPVGLITHESLQQTSRPIDLLRLRQVAEVMTEKVISASADSSLLTIAQTMAEHRISCVIIVESISNATETLLIPIGIITERDLVQFQALGLNSETCKAKTVMSTPVFTVKPDDSLWRVQQIVEQHFIHRLAVTGKRGELLGIVTQSSLLQILHPLELYNLAEVLGVKVAQLEAEKITLLKNRTVELEQQVEARTAALNAKIQQEKLIAHLAAQIRSSLSLQTILETTVAQIRQVLGCDRVTIWQFIADWETIAVAESTDSPVSSIGERVRDICFQQEQAEIYRQGKIRVVSDIYTTEMSDCHRQMAIRLQIRAKILVPLMCGDKLWGLLNAVESQHARNWQQSEVELLQALSLHLAIALQQATIHQQLQEELSQRKQAQAHLLESEARWQFALEGSGDGVWDWNVQTDRVFFSRQWKAMLGYSDSEVGNTLAEWHSRVHPDDKAGCYADLNKHLRGQTPTYQNEHRIRCQDGSYKWILDRGKVIERTADGKPLRVIGTHTDITDRKAAESVLRQYERMVASATDGIALLDRNYIYRFVNRVYLERNEKSVEEIIGHSVAELLGETGFQTIIQPYLDRCLTGKVQQYEEWFDYQNGSRRFIRVTYNPYFDLDGTITGIVVTTHDLTALKQTEQALQESEQFLRSIYEGVEQAIFTVDVLENGEFRHIAFNPAATRLWGKLIEEIDANSPEENFHYINCVRTGSAISYEQCVISNNTPTWWLTALNPIRDSSSRIYRIVGTSTDITLRKQAQTMLKLQNSILERIAKAEPLSMILDALLGTVELQIVDSLCSIMLCDGDGKLHCTVAPQLPEGYLRAIDGISIGEGVGSCGTAAFRREPVIVSDIATDPLWENYQNLALEYGLKACWSLPIISSDNRILGVFAIYYRRICTPQTQELENMIRIANIAGIAIERDLAAKTLQQLNQNLENLVAERTAALQASEERWHLALKGANDGIWDWDLKTNRIFFSDRWKEMRGFTSEEIGNTLDECLSRIHPDDFDRVMTALDEHFASRTEFFEVEYRVRRKDGAYMWVLDRAQALRDESGQVVRMIGSESDITARKQAEIALRDSERRYATLAAAAPVAIFRFDTPLNCVYVSDRWSEMTGRPIESALGTGWIDSLHPQDRDRLLEQYTQRYTQSHRDNRVFNCGEGRHLCPDGTVNWFYVQVVKEIDADGRLIGYIGTLTDITENKQIEAKLQNINQALQNAVEGISRLDIDRRYVSVNPAYAKLCGYEPNETIGMEWLQTVHPDDIAMMEAAYREMLKTNKAEVEVRGIRKDKSSFHQQVTMIAAYDEIGNFVGHYSFSKDISDRKQAEEILKAERLRLQLALDAAEMGTWSCSLPVGKLIWSDRTQEIFGFVPGTFSGDRETFIAMVHPEDTARVLESISATFETKAPYRIEYRIRRLDGEIRWLAVWGVILNDVPTTDRQIVGVVSDITEMKQAEIALQESEMRFRRMFDSSVVGMIFADFQGHITAANDFFLEMMGYTREELDADAIHWDAITPEEHMPADIRAMEHLIQYGYITPWEKEYYRKDGSRISVLIGAALLPGTKDRTICVVLDISDRKQAERENERLKNRLQFVLSSTPAAIYTCELNPNYRTTFISDNIRTVMGYTPEEFLSTSGFWADHINPEDAPRILAELSQLFERGHYIYEYRFLHKDGTYRWVRDEFRLVRNREGNPVEIVGYIADISARKQIEAELANSEAKYRGLVEGANDTIWLSDINKTLIYLSPQFKKLFGWDANEWIGKPFTDLVHPDDLPFIETDRKQNIELSKKSNNVEFRHRHRDGHYVWVRTSATPIHSDEGQVIGVQGILSDISELKQAEIALQTSENRFRQVFTSNIVGVMFTDFSGQIFDANDRFLEIIGYTREDLNAERINWINLTPIEHIANDRKAMAHLECYQAIDPWEKEYYRQDGSRVSVLVGVALLSETDSTCVCVVMDISDRKQYELQLKETNENLARATRLKDEFLANMSHELRTPLNAILGMAEGLQDLVFGSLNERQIRALQTISRSGSHLLEVINDILDVAKIESGQIELNFIPTAIAPLCQSSLTFIKQQALKKNIQLEIKLPDNLPDLSIDERRIRQVLINLLNNAVKFTPAGGRITLEVSLKQDNTNSDSAKIASPSYLQIAVIDTGIGIAPENINKLFQPFIQIDSALNRQYTGTGLGLVLVKRIVELHGGQVGVTSELGVGSRFTIELPCIVAAPSLSVPETQAEPYPELSQPEQEASPLILLAEDNEVNINTIASYLTVKGYRLLIAKNGLEAIELAESEKPELILMDIQMPEMDGLEATQKIRRNPNLADIPIVALTALAMDSDRDRCFAAGVDEYLTKPVKLKQLVTTIQRFLKQGNPRMVS